MPIQRWKAVFLVVATIFSAKGCFSDSSRSLNKNENGLNLLLVTIDTLRADRLGCYGARPSVTDRIDRLSSRGTLFHRAFANTTTTLPSHTNIMLGKPPTCHGVHDNLNFQVREENVTLAEILRSQGYATAAFVGAYTLDARFGLSQGFELYDDNYQRTHSINPAHLERRAELVVGGALEWIRNQRGSWFAWVHCWDPHYPYDPPEPYKTRYAKDLYSGEIAYVDAELGRLFSFLTEKELWNNTIVILTGDHGESLGDHGEKTHGFLAYNSTLWIPLIIVAPGKKSGRRIDAPVSHIDIFPTACDLIGIKKPLFLKGGSLAPSLQGKKTKEHPIYFESLYPYYSRGWAPIRGLIQGRMKFIDSPIPELYDLHEDFQESSPIDVSNKLGRYRRRLSKIIEEQTAGNDIDAKGTSDRGVREKMASLGYISTRRSVHKEKFGAEDDVKNRLPLMNRADELLALHEQGRPDEAILGLEELLSERNDIDSAYLHLATVYQETSRIDESLRVLEKGVRSIPGNYEIFQNYIKLLNDTGHYDRVIRSYKYASFEEKIHDPEVLNNLGIAFSKRGEYEQAVDAYRAGLSLDDRYPELYNNLANALFSQSMQDRNSGLFEESLELYKKAIEIDPFYPAAYFGLGHAYRQAGDIRAAIFCWEKTLEVDRNFRPVYVDLAFAYFNVHEIKQALTIINNYKIRYHESMSQEEKSQLEDFLKKLKDGKKIE